MKTWIRDLILVSLFLFSSAFAAISQNDVHVRTKPLPKTVALTFDDGPAEKYTKQILEILDRYHIKATFFMVGSNAKAHPELVKAVLEKGHVIASHSLTHPNLTKLSDGALEKEIREPQKIILSITGNAPKCLRYPFGASNAKVRDQIRAAGIVPVSMGFNSFDYDRPGTDKIVSWILKNVYAGQVFLFHDGYNHREQTVEALPKIIEGIQKKGLGFSVICE